MRTIPNDILEKASLKVQTKANNANPSTALWISRPETALKHNIFLERQRIVSSNVTDVSIAVCHPRLGLGDTNICIAYISNGLAKVSTSFTKIKMENHIWFDYGFSEEADALAISFDGTMPKGRYERYEFVTETSPWIFWCKDGICYGQKLNDSSTRVILASANCTDISAVRATWSDIDGFDFGLCLFMIVDGDLYYRQLINGEWTDASPISFGPSVEWLKVSASRTWDFRVALQLTDSSNNSYEMFTKYCGIGVRNQDHISINKVKAHGEMMGINFRNGYSDPEHLEIPDITAGALYGGLYNACHQNFYDAYNVSDGNGDYGKKAIFVFDTHLQASSVSANPTAFSIIDSLNVSYAASTARLEADGKTVTLTFSDFNNASGLCYATVEGETLITMADTIVDHIQMPFTPINLVPTEVDSPVPIQVWNEDPNGEDIFIEFNDSIIGSAAGNESYFTVTVTEPEWVVDGATQNNVKTVVSTESVSSTVIKLNITPGNKNSIQNGASVSVAYAGGNLTGQGGVVESFLKVFIPTGLAPKPDQNIIDRIEIGNIAVNTNLMKIHYTDSKSVERFDISSIVATGTLIDVSVI